MSEVAKYKSSYILDRNLYSFRIKLFLERLMFQLLNLKTTSF